jgi:hypothetical protein
MPKKIKNPDFDSFFKKVSEKHRITKEYELAQLLGIRQDRISGIKKKNKGIPLLWFKKLSIPIDPDRVKVEKPQTQFDEFWNEVVDKCHIFSLDKLSESLGVKLGKIYKWRKRGKVKKEWCDTLGLPFNFDYIKVKNPQTEFDVFWNRVVDKFEITSIKDLSVLLDQRQNSIRRAKSQRYVPTVWYKKLNIDLPVDRKKLLKPKKISFKYQMPILYRILLDYGRFIHDLIVNYPETPTITMADIAKEAGISRERVRQWVMLVYGTTEKSRPTLKCGTEVKKVIELKRQFKELVGNKIEYIGGRDRDEDKLVEHE